VFGEIELPLVGGDWREQMRRRAASARDVLRRHAWAIALLQSRSRPGEATLRHHNAVIGTLRAAGFSVELTAHAMTLIDSYVYGFTLSETSLPISDSQPVAEVAQEMSGLISPAEHPYLLEFTTAYVLQPGYDYGQEFDRGLDAILDALARSLAPQP
jgi:hypothetical protein